MLAVYVNGMETLPSLQSTSVFVNTEWDLPQGSSQSVVDSYNITITLTIQISDPISNLTQFTEFILLSITMWNILLHLIAIMWGVVYMLCPG